MPKQFEIRPAQVTDCAQILDLIKELALYEKEPDAVETTIKDLEEALFVGSNTLIINLLVMPLLLMIKKILDNYQVLLFICCISQLGPANMESI
jgi:hypothetical protein